MPTDISSNPFPLGLVTPTPGTPAVLTATTPDFTEEYVNAILLETADHNRGKCWFGNTSLNKATNAGISHQFLVPGDVFVLSTNVQNMYRLAEFRIDTEIAGDGVFVSVYVR